MGIYVIVGASLLGTASCVLIAWSLWSRNRPRRPRSQSTGAHMPVHPGQQYQQYQQQQQPDYTDEGEPSTQFLSEAELFGAGGPLEGKPRRTQFMSSSDSGSAPRRTMILSEPTEEVPPPGMATQFLSASELFPDEAEPATQFLNAAELFGPGASGADDHDDDEHEVATQFLSSEELFGAQAGAVAAAPPMLAPPARTEETVVLGAAPAHHMPMGSPSNLAGPPLMNPAARAQPRMPAPARASQQLPPSRLPAGVAAAPPGAIVRPPPPQRPAAAVPAAAQPSAAPAPKGYVGFVGAPLVDDDDDDDDFDEDEDDPETEMVHQAELLRLMTNLQSKPPGSQ